MKTKHIIIGLIILIGILFFTQKKEHAGTVPPPATSNVPQLSNEAIQNIAKVYADTSGTVVFNNLNVTGNTNLNGATSLNGDTLFTGNTTFKSSVTGSPTYFPFTDGKNYIRGPTQVDGNVTLNSDTLFTGNTTFKSSVVGMPTHFPYSDGKNYIRGPTQVDGNLNVTDAYNLTSRVLPGVYIKDKWNWGDCGREAVKYFKTTDPDGTFKIFAFSLNNHVKIIIYIKIGSRIYMGKILDSLDYMITDNVWTFDIP